jgi:hypothetical protein
MALAEKVCLKQCDFKGGNIWVNVPPGASGFARRHFPNARVNEFMPAQNILQPRRPPFTSRLFWLLFLSAFVFCAIVRADDFSSRRAAFLNYYDTTVPNVNQTGSGPHRIGRTGFWAAEGRFFNNDLVNGSNYMYAALGDADSEGTDAGFSMWPAMDCYLRWNAALPSVFTPAITNFFEAQLTTNGTNYSVGSTANQQMMFAATRYLAGSVWGVNAFPAGSQYQANYGTSDPTGKAFVSNTIVKIPFYGLLEHDSLIYVQNTLGPIYTLSQFAPDAVLQNKAKMAFDWVVAASAGYYFYDNWAVASDRTEPYWVQTQPTTATFMTYLFFGGPVPSSYLESYGDALYCMSNFPGVLPEVVMAATNRVQSYTHRSTDMENTGSNNVVYNNGYFKTSYITPDYSLYSQAECGVATNSDGSFTITNYGTVSLYMPHQMQRWGVVWNAPNDQTKFWITNPYNPVYSGSSPNIYIGTTTSEETVQLGGTLAAVYDIPTSATRADWVHGGVLMANYQLLEGQIPTNYTAVIDNAATSGRLFLHYTNVLIALYISTNFTWGADTNLTNYFLVPANIAGLAVETASPDEYTQSTAALRLAAFASDVQTHGSVNTNLLTGSHPVMIYTDRHTNTLKVAFGQGSWTNGQSVDYQQWPTICNPWMYQAQLGNLFIFGTNRTIIYNYNTWTETTNCQPVLLTSSPVTATQNNYVDVDLTARVSDTETPSSNLLFTVGNPANGAVALLADAHTARFTPSTNYSGAAGFNFTTTDFGTDPRLVLYYNFQPPNTLPGNGIADVSGNARNAGMVTAGVATAIYSTSAPPALVLYDTQSLRLTNTSTAGAELTRMITPGNLSMTNGSWTFATWFQRATATNDNFIFYIGSSNGFGKSGDELQLYCPSNQNTVALRHYNAGGTLDVNLTSAALVSTGQWHHVALVFQHIADGTNNVSLCLDGAPVGTVSNIAWSLKQNHPLVFGGHNSTNAKVYRWFNGLLDDLALFRGALNTNEIARLAGRTVSHFGGWIVTNSVSVSVVAPPNTPPVLAAISNYTINAGITLLITNVATDTDQPPQTLTFALAVAPTNALITPGTGILSWRPLVSQASSTNPFSVTVADNGTPSLGATQSFTVTVNRLNRPGVANSFVTNNQFWLQATGALGPDYTIQISTNLSVSGWTNIFTSNSPALPFNWADTNFQSSPQKFYRLLLGP